MVPSEDISRLMAVRGRKLIAYAEHLELQPGKAQGLRSTWVYTKRFASAVHRRRRRRKGMESSGTLM